MAKRRGLGRGLDALLSTGVLTEPDGQSPATSELKNLPVGVFERGRYQPRVQFDGPAMEALTDSVRAQGVVQPIVVRPLAGGTRYEIIAGERRWRAAQAAGLTEIPALVRDVADETALAVALVENIQREDLNPLEEARALKRLIAEFEMTHQEVGTVLGRSRAAVSNALRLLELTPEVSSMLEDGRLDMGHARALLSLQGLDQHRAALEIVANNLTAREAESLVRRMNAPRTTPKQPTQVDPDLRKLQEDLSNTIGAQVRINHRASGKGRLSVDYASLDQLEGILDRLHPGRNKDGFG